MADDFFALLGEPRRPWLDPDRIKDKFHALSRAQHPDQQATGSNAETDATFTRLNAAQAGLRDPKARLRHLLELEYPEIRLSGPASVPASLAELFAPIHALVQAVDALLAKKAAASSALAKALLARDEFSMREQAETRLGALETLHHAAVAELQAFDRVWDARSPDNASRLHELYQRFAYLSRWTEQLRERLYQLGM